MCGDVSTLKCRTKSCPINMGGKEIVINNAFKNNYFFYHNRLFKLIMNFFYTFSYLTITVIDL